MMGGKYRKDSAWSRFQTAQRHHKVGVFQKLKKQKEVEPHARNKAKSQRNLQFTRKLLVYSKTHGSLDHPGGVPLEVLSVDTWVVRCQSKFREILARMEEEVHANQPGVLTKGWNGELRKGRRLPGHLHRC